MVHKSLAAIIVVAALIVGGWMFYGIYSNSQNSIQTEEINNNNQSTETENNVQTNYVMDEDIKVFTVVGRNFSFSPAEIKVKQGNKVKIILDNVEGFHDWVVDEFNAATAQVQAPATTEVEFVADKSGVFEFYCSVGSHRKMGMVGNLIVE